MKEQWQPSKGSELEACCLYKLSMSAKASKIKRPGAKRGDVNRVKSGIGLSELRVRGGPALPQEHVEDAGAITSRTARVLLAGAGFLADAVRRLVLSLPPSPIKLTTFPSLPLLLSAPLLSPSTISL